MQFIDQIKQQYLKEGNNVFLLHGNTHDLFMADDQELRLRDYLVSELFIKRDIILFFNPGSGIKFYNDDSRTLFMQLIKGYDTLQGTNYFNELPSSYGEIMKLLDRFLRIQGKTHSIALIVDYAELLFPAGELSDLDQSDVTSIVSVLEWTSSSEITSHNITVCLIAENLSEVHNLLTRSALISRILVDLPDENARKQVISKYSKQYQVKLPQTQQALAKLTNGFTNEGLMKLMASSQQQTVDDNMIKSHKKELIEARTGGMVEFIETEHTLTDVAGHELAKKRLREDAQLLHSGNKDVMPMGYLICGPIGTGKSYLAECYAGEIGIPAIKLGNFREKWVGATEANWERILNTIKSLAPILVIVDEADAALGNREQDGDSGTQQRVFAKLAETMGDTKYRGEVMWMLLTARPELLPVDLKRQGRAEVHIPLLYPTNNQEKVEMFKAMAHKVKFAIDDYVDQIANFNLVEVNSGADIEAVLVKAKRDQALQKNKPLSLEQFKQVVESFRTSLDKAKIQEQIDAALAEVTDRELVEEVYWNKAA